MHVIPLGLCPREQKNASQHWLFLNRPVRNDYFGHGSCIGD